MSRAGEPAPASGRAADLPGAGGDAIFPNGRTLAMYALAVALPLAMLPVRQILPVSFGDRPLLIRFMPALIVAALLGGLGPGLVATATAAVCTAFSILPAGAIAIAAGHDLIQWGMLLASGVLVSLLSEGLHRAWRREAERRRQLDLMQKEWQRSEARFEATFEQAAVGVALVAPDGRWLRVNRKLCAIVGYSQEELLGKTFQDITHPDDMNADLEAVRRMLAREIDAYAMEKRYLRKDGAVVWTRLTVALYWNPDGRPGYFIAVVEDIDARKQAEQALGEAQAAALETQRQAQRAALGLMEDAIAARHRAEAVNAELRASERRFHDIVNASADWVWETDAQARFTYASESVQDLLGYTAAEIIGRTPFDLMPPAEAERVRAAFAAIAARREPFRDLDNINVHKDGSLRHVSTNGMPILDADGMVLGYRGLDRDVSEKRRAELELRTRNAELERFNRASVGRELDMIALKQQVNALSRRLGLEAPFPLAFVDTSAAPPGGPTP